MTKSAMEALFDPVSVAVVGATDDLGKPGGRCLAFLRQYGYRGRIYPINPKYETVRELPCYPDLKSLPGPVEMVVLLVPAKAVPGHLRDAAAAGARAAVVCSSGFAEAGAAGARLQEELVRAAAESGMAVLGPNSLGMLDLHHGLVASFSTGLQAESPPKAGPIAFVSQSGAIGAVVYALAQRDGIGFGKFLSTGNEAVLDFGHYLDHFADDPDVTLVLGYIEGIRRGRPFIDAARRAHAAGKTVAVLKVGQSEAGVKAARSHTGALVGSAMVYEAAFRRAGVLTVNDVRSLLDLAVAIPGRYRAQGPRVGIVSMSGGAGVMMADKCTASGLEMVALAPATRDALAKVLPDFAGMANPVDFGFVYGDPDAVEACVNAVAADPGIDLVLVFIGLSPDMAGVLEHRIAGAQDRSGKPVVTAWLGGPEAGIAKLRALGVAAYDDPSRAVEVAALMARAAAPLPGSGAPAEGAAAGTADGTADARAKATRATLRGFAAAGATALTEREVKALLAPYGVPVTPEVLAVNRAEALAAAQRFTGAVAIKAEAPALLHKSDAGAVKLGVAPADAGDAFDAVVAAAVHVVGRSGVRGAVVQPMAPAGLEILAGLRFDPQFGPTITVALGGVMSEVLADVATELAPIDRAIAEGMLGRLRGAPLLGAFRGATPRDRAALVSALVALGAFAMDAGDLLAELDLNPVIVMAEGAGCVVVDGAAVLKS